MALIITCPECTAKLKAPAAIPLGKKLQCPKCKKPFAVSEDNMKEVPDMKPAPAVANAAVKTAPAAVKTAPPTNKLVANRAAVEEEVARPMAKVATVTKKAPVAVAPPPPPPMAPDAEEDEGLGDPPSYGDMGVPDADRRVEEKPDDDYTPPWETPGEKPRRLEMGSLKTKTEKTKGGGKAILMVILIFIILGGAGAGAYFAFFNDETPAPTPAKQEPTKEEPKDENEGEGAKKDGMEEMKMDMNEEPVVPKKKKVEGSPFDELDPS